MAQSGHNASVKGRVFDVGERLDLHIAVKRHYFKLVLSRVGLGRRSKGNEREPPKDRCETSREDSKAENGRYDKNTSQKRDTSN